MFADFNNKTRTIKETVEEFVNTKKGKKAQETVKYYEERLGWFMQYLDEEKGITDLLGVTRAVVDCYMDFKKMKNPSLSNQSLNNFLRAIRTFVNYCIGEGYISPFKIEMFLTTNTPKRSYIGGEQALLLKKLDMSKCTFTQYRNWVITCYLLASGNCSKTVRYIMIKHVELEKRRITLETTKNNEILYMPISDTCYPILHDYMKSRNGQPDDYLFCNQFGKQLTGGGLRSVMRKHNLKHGVNTTRACSHYENQGKNDKLKP